MVTRVKGPVSDSPPYTASAPSTGTWELGDVVFNYASGGNTGWRCVAAGTPGTWRPFGFTFIDGSAASVPVTLADGASASRTITVAGAAVGDFVSIASSVTTQGVTVIAWISAADTVSVTLLNQTGGSISLASMDLYARVQKRT